MLGPLDVVGLHVTEVYEVLRLKDIIWVEVTNFVWLEKHGNGAHFMERIHFPEWVDGSTSCHHDLLSSSWMDFDEIGDIVYSIFIGHPDLVLE